MSAVHIFINEQILLPQKQKTKKEVPYIFKVKYHTAYYKEQGKTITYIQALHIPLKYRYVYKDYFGHCTISKFHFKFVQIMIRGWHHNERWSKFYIGIEKSL